MKEHKLNQLLSPSGSDSIIIIDTVTATGLFFFFTNLW